MNQLVELIKGNKLRKRTEQLAEAVRDSLVIGSTGHLDAADALPVVNFSHTEDCNQILVLLSFRTGQNQKLLRQLSEKVKVIPQTVLAFTGASGRSLKVVTATSPVSSLTKPKVEWERMAFLSAANYYGQALGFAPESREESSLMACRLGATDNVWLNESYMPVPVFDHSELNNNRPANDVKVERNEFDSYTGLELQLAKFNYVFEQLSFEEKKDEEFYLTTLAERCRKSGIEEEVAVKNVLCLENFRNKEFLVRSTFQTAYNDHPLGMDEVIDPKIIQQYRLEAFLRRRYNFRRNKINGCVEYRELGRYLLSWRPLDGTALNSITRNAILEGINIWDKDVKRFVCSDSIEEYDPIADFLYQLPKWDGVDRLKEMAARVTTNDELWEDNFKIWMRSMVSQWMGRNRMYGSSMVLMLTGAQGTGKSTFIRLLMPPELSAYYLDRLDFSTKKEAERALTHFALINIDEFDQISKSQTAYLKHLLQKTSVTQRKMYEDSYTQQQRYATFAATTNSAQPLVDPTGSRRYMVEEVMKRIDVRTMGDHAINYPQMYAQVVAEIRSGGPSYFDKERERKIQYHNLNYTFQEPLFDAFAMTFRKPEENAEPLRLSPTEMLETIHQQYKGIQPNRNNAIKLGKYLVQHKFRRESTHERFVYDVARK
jgi:hypothetical protein